MRLIISIVAALGLCVGALVACSPQDGSAPAASTGSSSSASGNTTAQTTKQTPAPAPQAGETRRISIEESQAAVADGKALIVDVRDENTYKTSHIKGAKSVPLQQFEARAGELPKDKLIITYCA